VPAYGENVLFVGSSGGGKSTLAKRFLERQVDLGYQFCVIDPEGDYEDFDEAVVLGDRARVPSAKEVLQLLKDPKQNAVANLLGLGLEQRPAFFSALLTDLVEMRSRTGRPHWLIVDEAHHVLPRERGDSALTLSQQLTNIVFIAVEPETMLKQALQLVSSCFAVGEHPEQAVKAFARAIGQPPPEASRGKLETGEALFWRPGKPVTLFRVGPTRFQHRRHRRKYAQGDVGPELSFYFRGPDRKLNLRAQNLITFAQIADGVDDETWLFHLRCGDYARWFRDVVKDEELAKETAALQARSGLSPEESRRRVLDAIAKRYTLPASAEPSPKP
jgi:GTPase SAR1 family protein